MSARHTLPNDLPPSHQWTDIVVPLKAEEMMARIKGRFD